MIIGIYQRKTCGGGFLEVKTIENIEVCDNARVRVKEMGNIIEIMYSDTYESKCSIKRLDSDTYLDLRTGETKEFKKMENRACDMASVKKTLGRLRDYINTNVVDVKKCKWITLTYRDNMTDTGKLYRDFDNFNRRLRKELGFYEYIASMEPQGRGAWHCHVILIFENMVPYIPNDVVWRCWSPKGFKARLKDGKGYDYVVTKKLDDVDNVGAYLTAYLGDMEYGDFSDNLDGINFNRSYEIKELEIDGKSKRYIKGGRLHLYPSKFNIYRCSTGIKKPIVYYDTERNAQKKVSAGTLTFQKSVQLSEQTTNFSKVLDYRYYNLTRK